MFGVRGIIILIGFIYLLIGSTVKAGSFGNDVEKFVSFKPRNRESSAIQFGSDMSFGEITLEKKTGEQFQEFVFIKTQRTRDVHLPKEVLDGFFHNEVLFYSEIVPLLRKYDKDDFLSKSLPKFLYGKATNGQNSDEDIIILKDLREESFKPYKSARFLDAKHAQLMLDRLGKYHALSMMCKIDDPVAFEKVSSLIIVKTMKQLNEYSSEEVFRQAMLRGVEPLKEDLKYRDRLTDLCANYCDKAFERMEHYKVDTGPLNVITYGDLHCDNMMFKYNSDGEPCEVAFFDFACVRLCSSAIDTGRALFLTVEPKIRHSQWENLLQSYYEGLSHYMNDRLKPPSFETVYMDLREKGVHSYFIASYMLPAFYHLWNGGHFNLTPGRVGSEETEQQPTSLEMYKVWGGPAVTEILADIVRLMLDEDFIFEN